MPEEVQSADKRAERRSRTYKKIANRVKFIKKHYAKNAPELTAQPHRYNKAHPADCGRPKCQLCSGDKLFGKKSKAEIIAEEKYKQGVQEAGILRNKQLKQMELY